jgi:hypothetical protein
VCSDDFELVPVYAFWSRLAGAVADTNSGARVATRASLVPMSFPCTLTGFLPLPSFDRYLGLWSDVLIVFISLFRSEAHYAFFSRVSKCRSCVRVAFLEMFSVVNNNNFARGAAGEPTLLSMDDVKTLFHEAGHGCHGMLSNCTYQRLASTNVLRDFVELPSQLMEHWVDRPEVLKKHAKHYKTGEVIPDSLLAKFQAARKFNMGFGTIEYTASALVDQSLHVLGQAELKV